MLVLLVRVVVGVTLGQVLLDVQVVVLLLVRQDELVSLVDLSEIIG